jgi:hypothetical protein
MSNSSKTLFIRFRYKGKQSEEEMRRGGEGWETRPEREVADVQQSE